MQQMSAEDTFKEMHRRLSKGKSSETFRYEPSEAQIIPGIDIPLTSVLPEPNPINISSSTSHDTTELDKEAEELIKESIARFGETPNPEAVAQQLFEI
ncbi:hypothetical protein A2U01_0062398, partial [Trifolium medium]|nr:hypothetical protein [Trifolium medium]